MMLGSKNRTRIWFINSSDLEPASFLRIVFAMTQNIDYRINQSMVWRCVVACHRLIILDEDQSHVS